MEVFFFQFSIEFMWFGSLLDPDSNWLVGIIYVCRNSSNSRASSPPRPSRRSHRLE